MFDFMPKGKPKDQEIIDENQAAGDWQEWQKGPSLDLSDPLQAYRDQLPGNFTPIQPLRLDDNREVGKNLFISTPFTFPILRNDNPVIKGLKGAANAVTSLAVGVPGEIFSKANNLYNKGIMEAGSLLSGNGLRTDLPENATFTQDILKPALPSDANDSINQFQQEHSVLGGLAEMGLDTITSPFTFIGGKTIKNAVKPESTMLKPYSIQDAQDLLSTYNPEENIRTLPYLKRSAGSDFTPLTEDIQAQRYANSFSDMPIQTPNTDFPSQNSVNDLLSRANDELDTLSIPRKETPSFSGKFTTGEQRALAELEDGIRKAQDFLGSNKLIDDFSGEGFTNEAAFDNIKHYRGVDLPQLVANYEKATATVKSLTPEQRSLGRVAGVLPELRKPTEGITIPQPKIETPQVNIPTQSEFIQMLHPEIKRRTGTQWEPLTQDTIQARKYADIPTLEPRNLPGGTVGQARQRVLNPIDANLQPDVTTNPLEPLKVASARIESPSPVREAVLTQQPIETLQPKASGNEPLPTLSFNQSVPQVEPVGVKRLSFPDTVARGEITDPELAKKLDETELNYGNITNKDTLEVAREFIQKDKDAAIQLVMSDNPATAESNAVAQLLIKEANDTGKFDEAINMIEKTSQKARTQGQAIQALSMWGRLSPEGILKYADRVIKQAHDAGKTPETKISEDVAKDLVEQAKDLQKLPEGSRERRVGTAKMLDTVAAQVPASFGQKIATLQIMAQLLNPKTSIRNILGNAGFAGMENISQTVGAGIDKAIGVVTGKRTMTLPSLKTQTSGAKTGWKLGLEDAVKGINTSSLTTQFDIAPTRTFRGGILGKLETAMNVELRGPDRAFYQAAYDDSLRSQMKAAGVSEPTEAMKEIADYDGLYRTFQDNNYFSDLFSSFKKKLNGGKDFGIGDFVLKYPRTPANLLARGIDYSPAGFVNVIMQSAKPLMGKEFNQREFVQAFSRAITGSAGLVGMGALLHNTGIISGARNQDPDVASMEDAVGLGDYKINVSALKRFVLNGFNPETAKLQKGDTLVTYDWFQPQALPIAMGADIDKNGAKAEGVVGTLLNGLATGVNTFAEQPVMQGVSTLLGQRDFSKGITQIMQGIPASFVPTVLNQIKQLSDNQKRNTYSPNWADKGSNLVVSKLPVLEKRLQPSIDALGNNVETYQNGSNNPFNVLLNPSFVSQYQPSKEAELALNAYNQTGETKQIPTIIPKYFTVSGDRFDLTPEEYATMQRIVGEATKKDFGKISTGLATDQQIERMSKDIEQARAEGKKAILNERGIRYKQSGNTFKLLK